MNMKYLITTVCILTIAGLLSGCVCNCYIFSDLAAGTTYYVGQTITTTGPHIKVEQFQAGDLNWTSSGFAKVDNVNYAKGSGNDIQSGNVNLFFLFDYPISKITFKFGELGGNNNIKVNGDFNNVENLIGLNGVTIGGVQIVVNATQQGNNWYGDMTLEGSINDFTLGGQELWIDDICHSK